MHTFVPTVTEDVKRLCRMINPASSPKFVQVRPDKSAKPLDCFNNVLAKIERDGGKMQYGWVLWQCSRYYLEAEHHAVYVPDSSSEWLDVTPQTPRVNQVLFLPQDDAAYDFVANHRRDNVRLPLLDDWRVREFCELTAEKMALLNSVPGVGEVTLKGLQAQRFTYIERRRAALMMELRREYEKTVGRNDLCPCGSQAKYKKCCGR